MPENNQITQPISTSLTTNETILEATLENTHPQATQVHKDYRTFLKKLKILNEIAPVSSVKDIQQFCIDNSLKVVIAVVNCFDESTGNLKNYYAKIILDNTGTFIDVQMLRTIGAASATHKSPYYIGKFNIYTNVQVFTCTSNALNLIGFLEQCHLRERFISTFDADRLLVKVGNNSIRRGDNNTFVLGDGESLSVTQIYEKSILEKMYTLD